MTIKQNIIERQKIDEEIKRLRKVISKLNKRKKLLEQEIIVYIKDTKQPGLKYQGTAIFCEKKVVNKRKKQEQKEKDVVDVLKKHGVEQTQEILNDLSNAQKGIPIEQTSLKFNKLKNKK